MPWCICNHDCGFNDDKISKDIHIAMYQKNWSEMFRNICLNSFPHTQPFRTDCNPILKVKSLQPKLTASSLILRGKDLFCYFLLAKVLFDEYDCYLPAPCSQGGLFSWLLPLSWRCQDTLFWRTAHLKLLIETLWKLSAPSAAFVVVLLKNKKNQYSNRKVKVFRLYLVYKTPERASFSLSCVHCNADLQLKCLF